METKNNYYVALKQKLANENIRGLRHMLYRVVDFACDEVIENGKNPNDYLEALLHGNKVLYVPKDVSEDLFISYLDEVSKWLAELIIFGNGLDVFLELGNEYYDPLCATKEARDYVINLLLFDIINVGLEEEQNG